MIASNEVRGTVSAKVDSYQTDVRPKSCADRGSAPVRGLFCLDTIAYRNGGFSGRFFCPVLEGAPCQSNVLFALAMSSG
jgi:hypothetical protein